MKTLVLGVITLVLMIGAPSVQAFTGIAKHGYDAGYFAAKAGKLYDFSTNPATDYGRGFDFGYRDGIQGAPYDPIKKYPNKDSEQEDGLPYDQFGRPCFFGPDHTECLEKTSDYQSGFNHGVADGNLATAGVDADYIHQPGQGFANHSTAFVDGYIKGWCSTANIGGHGAGGIEPNDHPEPTRASFDCDRGLSSAYPSPRDWPK